MYGGLYFRLLLSQRLWSPLAEPDGRGHLTCPMRFRRSRPRAGSDCERAESSAIGDTGTDWDCHSSILLAQSC